MPRRKEISDAAVLDLGLAMLLREGVHGPSFGDLGRVAGLAPSTLAQRFATQPGLRAAILSRGWDRADEALATAASARPPEGPNPVPFLKALASALEGAGLSPGVLLAGSGGSPALMARASAWRQAIEAALRLRLDPADEVPKETAAALFAAWQGRILWQGTAGGDFRLRGVARRRRGQK